jgi:hypothetical protein
MSGSRYFLLPAPLVTMCGSARAASNKGVG